MDTTNQIEHKIRMYVHQKRIRMKDFFIDFDRLRSGYVSKSQFQRCIDKSLQGISGLILTPLQCQQLVSKYSSANTDKVCYRDFVKVLDQDFQPDVLERSPEVQKKNSTEYLGTERSCVDAGADAKNKVFEILAKIAKYYQYRSLNIRTAYQDFDHPNNGLVTTSQFARNFPGPTEVPYEDIMMLASFYQDPVRQNLSNYLNFRNDLIKVMDEMYPCRNTEQKNKQIIQLAGSDEIVNEAFEPELSKVFEKVRISVHNNGIRTNEFFKDHDKLRSGLITRRQFLSGLNLCLANQAHLNMSDINKIADHYSTSSGHINYKSFCDLMEHAYNVPALDKNPTIHPMYPPLGSLSRPLGSLSDQEEQDLTKTLFSIGQKVRRRQLALHPYFKDFDRSRGYTRIVTKSQFARTLSVFNLLPDQHLFELICRKFMEPISGDVSYPAFCQAIDEQFVHYKIDKPTPPPIVDYVPPPLPIPVDTSGVDLCKILARIRHHVTLQQIRISEYFCDFDQLRSGLVTKAVFQRCLDLIGINWLNFAELYALKRRYESAQKPDLCSWFAFKREIEGKVEPTDLEKFPMKKVEPAATHILPKVGAVTSEMMHETSRQALHRTILRMRERAVNRSIDLKPLFQDFDRHNNGHVTRSQWRQVLATMDFNADDEEFAALSDRFCDVIGFNYTDFLASLVPTAASKLCFHDLLEHRITLRHSKKPDELNPLVAVEDVLKKIKISVANQRQRPSEFFKDYDKLRCGRVSKSNFQRSIDLFNVGLKESEMFLLMEAFESPRHPEFVDYIAFCDEIESIFTVKHLEKMPLVTPNPFQPPVKWHANHVGDHEKQLQDVMVRLARHVSRVRPQLFPLFEDFDVTHNGHVSTSQFYRVLTGLHMNNLLNSFECQLICERFKVLLGERLDVDYVAFCDSIYAIAGFEPNKP